MSLMDAPAYDDRRARRNQALLIAFAILLGVLVVLTFAGRLLGHGWLFTDLPAEHRVNQFYSALEAKDYAKAYGVYVNDADWQAHADKYRGYSLARFTEDWTTSYSPVNGPVISHHVDVSSPDGTGFFGTGIIVGARLNGDHKVFIYVDRSDGTLIYPSPHVIEY